ncbi:hypothetical protein [Bailinhaonella thermotolerans]|uniref:Uncharacterized protein n=1 Tax=Bailinhaonella thermotolerans TaxID=1070861 RepID=A0A3A4A1G3_9ACTN|nr:hypothetical protein [Bailinhaonella thermotolerans]RJL21102.1 hypothetical protein D5H75_38475 [Bailinhaonella thermotolerans]
MGTRGFIGFVIDGHEKIAYVHADSYPGGVGASVLSWLRLAAADLGELRRRVRALRVVDPGTRPGAEDIEALKEFAFQRVSTGRLDDWYVLLRRTQGRPELMLAAGVIEDARDFPADSLDCEWGYLIDLDAAAFEVYRGFQRRPHAEGRFAGRPSPPHHVGAYYPVKRVGRWGLSDLPGEDTFLSELTARAADPPDPPAPDPGCDPSCGCDRCTHPDGPQP